MKEAVSILILCLCINGYAFWVMKSDKEKAKRHQWRTPERRMFVLAIFGGAVGIYFGMQVFHHKTKHLKFIVWIPILILWNVFLLALIWKLSFGM